MASGNIIFWFLLMFPQDFQQETYYCSRRYNLRENM